MLVLLVIMFYIGFIAVILAPANDEEDVDTKEIKRILVLISIFFALVIITLSTDNVISNYLFALVSGG